MLESGLARIPAGGNAEAPAEPFRRGADQPVRHDAEEGHAQPGDDAATGIDLGQGDIDLLAQVAGADQSGDHQHG